MNTEWRGHLRAASKEFMLALRGLMEASIERLDERMKDKAEEKPPPSSEEKEVD